MYRVYMDHELVYMPGDRTLALFSAKAELRVNGTGSFTFMMYPDHPAYGKIELMRNIIAIHSDSQSDPLFLCRPYQIEYGTHNEAKVSCEGTLGFLNDSLVEPVNMDFADNPMNPVTLLGIVIDAHNSYVGDGSGKRIQLGTVRSDLGDALISDENVGSYPSSWNVVTNYLVERFGGYIVPGYAIVDGSYATYLNWYSSIEQVGTQTVELGKNLVKFNRVLDGTDAFSTIIPQGKDGITIATDDDPATSITDPELEAAYGRISRVVEFDTDDPADLKVQALKYIADEKAKATEEITVGAVDLSLADKSVEAFRLGEKIIVDSPYHGLVSEEFVTDTISINLNKPSDGTLTLGKSKKYLTKQNSDDIRHRVDRLERKQDVSFTGYLGQHDSAPTAGLKDGAFFLYTGETTDTMTQGRIYEYDAETMSWGKTTDEYAVMACLHDALTNAKDTDMSLYALVAFVYTIGVHNLLVDAGGKIQSANYTENSDGSPASGFRLAAFEGILSAYDAVLRNVHINGGEAHLGALEVIPKGVSYIPSTGYQSFGNTRDEAKNIYEYIQSIGLSVGSLNHCEVPELNDAYYIMGSYEKKIQMVMTVEYWRIYFYNQSKTQIAYMYTLYNTGHSENSNGTFALNIRFVVGGNILKFVGLPTSANNLESGQVYSDSGTLKIK